MGNFTVQMVFLDRYMQLRACSFRKTDADLSGCDMDPLRSLCCLQECLLFFRQCHLPDPPQTRIVSPDRDAVLLAPLLHFLAALLTCPNLLFPVSNRNACFALHDRPCRVFFHHNRSPPQYRTLMDCIGLYRVTPSYSELVRVHYTALEDTRRDGGLSGGYSLSAFLLT